jgi:DNA-binding response OmpR family regulator
MPLNSAKRQITVSSQGKRSDIVYPCLISEVREIYNGLYSQSSLKSDSTDDGIKIVFYESQSDRNKNLVCVNNRKYILSDTEYKILTLLCKSPQEAISREKIQGLLENEKSNIGDVYICRLRKKLEEPLGQRLIFTVRGKGYKIVADAEWR